MNDQGLLGALLPVWIIGAPLLAGIFMMFVTPKPRHRDSTDADALRDRQPAYGDPARPGVVGVVAAPPRY